MDVISHFYRPRLPFTWNEPELSQLLEQFTIQQRIERRFESVMKEVYTLVEPVKLTHLTFVTHSQGTVIALDVLWQALAHQLLKEAHHVEQVNLVTMGSPITHLYQTYFPDRYPALFVNGTLNRSGWGTTLTQTVDEWVNVYRVDDFVGTLVRGRQAVADDPSVRAFPINQFLDEGGHTKYW